MSIYSLSNLKLLIESYFKDPQISATLKSIFLSEKLTLEDLDDELKILALIKKANLLERLYSDLKSQIPPPANPNPKPKASTPTPLSLSLHLISGKAFLPPPAGPIFVCLNFFGVRKTTRLIKSSTTPIFDELFTYPFEISEFAYLNKLDRQIEMVVVCLGEEGKKVVGFKLIEWRFVLCYGKVNLNLEIVGDGRGVDGRRNSLGIIQIELALDPTPNHFDLLSERLVNEQIDKERKYKDVDTVQFYEYSTAWWAEFKTLSKAFEKRAVKIYGETEDFVFKPVTAFIVPLFCNGIDSPYHAARFVSLIPLKKMEKPGGERIESMLRFHTFLSGGGGDYEDHAHLLCSLLLGFGMEAFVVSGSSSEGGHAWVVTLGKKITYWESLTGTRYDQKDPRVNSLYRKVACIYNDRYFYGNIQQNDSGYHTVFNLNDSLCWKKMSEEKIKLVKDYQSELELMSTFKDALEEEKELESRLKLHIEQYRKSLNLHTKFDNILSHYLTMALTNYEQERLTGQTFGNEEFQNAIRKRVPENHTFKAFPIQFTQKNSDQIFNTLLNAQVCREIMNTNADSTYFAIKSKFVVYPENVFVIWISVAVRYLSLD